MAKPKKPELTEDDIIAFREAMRGVKPLKHNAKVSLRKVNHPTPKIRRHEETDDEQEISFEFSDYENLAPVNAEDLLEFARSGVQYKMIRELRLGQFHVDAILDLHGKTVDQARQALSNFLLRCKHDALRHVLIIHGKGRYSSQPVLKNKLNHWLRQTKQVLAFCSASPKGGSSGALNVLLKR